MFGNPVYSKYAASAMKRFGWPVPAGVLYVLKGCSYVRISIGGRRDQQTRIRKTKAAAGKVLDRL